MDPRSVLPIAAAVLAAATLAATPAPATTTRVSLDSLEQEGDGPSNAPHLSADGRYVLFASTATNLVPDDTNHQQDLFLRDLLTGATERVSLDGSGQEHPAGGGVPAAVSGDGNVVVYRRISGQSHTWVHDRTTGTSQIVSVAFGGGNGNGASGGGDVSDDGRYVAFHSAATNLVASDTNLRDDIFVRDLSLGVTELASVNAAGDQANGHSYGFAISADGRYVVFRSAATNLVASDTNGQRDLFLRDRVAGTTEIVSLTHDGGLADNGADHPSVSDDGRYVAFDSRASNLVPGDTNGPVSDVYVRDRTAGTTIRVSVGPGGEELTEDSYVGEISGDGRYVVFDSYADDVVADDTNGQRDSFVYDLATGRSAIVSLAYDGSQGDGTSAGPSIAADGSLVAFYSSATNLVADDTNATGDIFLRAPGAVDAPIVPAAASGLVLGAARPNPMTAVVEIPVTLETAGRVRAEVLDVRGRRVRTLLDAVVAGPTRIRWDGRGERADVPAGVYFVRVYAGGTTAARKVTVTR